MIYKKGFQTPRTVLPVVYSVGSDFSITARVLTPQRLTTSVYDPNNREPIKKFTNSIDSQIRTHYNTLLSSKSKGYFWKGIPYPYGGQTGKQIKAGMQTSNRRNR